MSEAFLGMIIMGGWNFAPRSWALCDGQLLPISGNSALFSLLGTTYGGDGRTTFALPDLRGRIAIHPGNGPGLTPVRLGERGGRENVTLTINELPSHNHTIQVGKEGMGSGATTTAAGSYLGDAADAMYRTAAGTGTSPGVMNTGGNRAFNIRNPYLGVNYVIALQGVFPSRS
ncbi:MAG: phage tail protein [Saprospiraceae bacterium]